MRALHHLVHDLGRTDILCALIGGFGSAQPGLKQLATQLGLDDYVWFTGFVSDADVERYLASADICVDPDPSNPFNDRSSMTKMPEYMARGRPIVAFDLPEHRFTAQAAAIYVRPNDELEFARALAQLMDDPARRQTMGALVRRRVETELAWHYSARHLVEHAGDLESLMRALERDCLGERCAYFEVRPRTALSTSAPELEPAQTFCLHSVDLTPGLEDIFHRLHKDSIQRKIRRADRDGVIYEEGRGDALLEQFYHLLLRTRRR